MVKINVNYSGFKAKTDPVNYYRFINSVLGDILANWQKTRYGKPSGMNPSVSKLTNLVKGKDSPLIDSGQLRMGQRVEQTEEGKFIIGIDKLYGKYVMEGGKFTAKRVFVIPCTREVKKLLKEYQKVKSVIEIMKQRYAKKKNSSIVRTKKGWFLVQGISNKNIDGKIWTPLFLFRKTITLPKRQILSFEKNDREYLNKAIGKYFESN